MSKKVQPKPVPPNRHVTLAVNASDVFHVSFDTEKRPGYLTAVRVVISEDIVMVDETVCIALVDHPLYKKLQEYVLANPR